MSHQLCRAGLPGSPATVQGTSSVQHKAAVLCKTLAPVMVTGAHILPACKNNIHNTFVRLLKDVMSWWEGSDFIPTSATCCYVSCFCSSSPPLCVLLILHHYNSISLSQLWDVESVVSFATLLCVMHGSVRTVAPACTILVSQSFICSNTPR